jgi:hypothetical protein
MDRLTGRTSAFFKTSGLCLYSHDKRQLTRNQLTSLPLPLFHTRLITPYPMPIHPLLLNTQSKPPNLSPHLKPYLTPIHHQKLHIVHGTFPRRAVTPHSSVCHPFH